MLTLTVREREALGEIALELRERERGVRQVAERIADLLVSMDHLRSKLERICTAIDERNRPFP
jgi:hypothetical protein